MIECRDYTNISHNLQILLGNCPNLLCIGINIIPFYLSFPFSILLIPSISTSTCTFLIISSTSFLFFFYSFNSSYHHILSSLLSYLHFSLQFPFSILHFFIFFFLFFLLFFLCSSLQIVQSHLLSTSLFFMSSPFLLSFFSFFFYPSSFILSFSF